MNKKNQVSKFFACSLAVLSILLITTNSVFTQCGNYFKQNYSGIFKMQFPTSPVYLDDWTGDGKSDFWTLKRTSSGALLLDVLIYPAKATGYWDWDNPIVYTTNLQNINGTMAVKDFDGDGRMDLAFGLPTKGQILRNAGNGSLAVSGLLNDSDGTIGSGGHIGFPDINGDGRLDWLYSFSSGSTSQIRYQLQNADGSFGSKTTILAPSAQYGDSFYSSVFGDFNGDGKIDIVTNANLNNTVNPIMLKNLGGGNFETVTNQDSNLYVFRAEVRDFNNDGRDDILGRNYIFFGKANSGFDRIQLQGSSDNQYNIYPAKLNNDNSWDAIELIGTNSYATYINDGTGNFSKTVYSYNFSPLSYGTTYGLKFEDFNNDGKADFYDTRTNIEYKYNVLGERILPIATNNCKPSGETKAVNFEGNFNNDVSTWNPNTGIWSSKNAIWGNLADSSSRVFNWGNGSLGDVPAPGDFDGDGKTDYSVYRNSTGVWYIYRSSDSTWQTFQFGISGDIAVPNDYDGGGKTDIAVFRPSNGSWYIWFSETQQFLGVQFGLDGDKAVPADYDGDNKTDIAVFRPSTGVWYYLKSSDGGFRAIQWGISTDKPIPADYDGDGKADLTIYRNGEWWMLRSSDNAPVGILYGTANDIPVPVYRNSVSADMTLYNPTNNTWNYFANRYSPGIPLGGSQDKPVYLGLPNS